MANIIQKLKEIYAGIRDKDMLIIWLVALGLFIILVVVSLFVSVSPTKNENVTEQKQTLNTVQFDNTNVKLKMDNTDYTPSSDSIIDQVYTVSAPDFATNIKSWLESQGQSSSTFQCDEFFCTWGKDDSSQVLTYSKSTGVISFSMNLNTTLDLQNPEQSAIDTSVQILKDITGKDYSFSDVFKSTSLGPKFTDGQIRFYLYRKDYDLNIWGDNELASGNYLDVDKNGKVIDAAFQVFDVIKTDSKKVKVSSDIQVINSILTYGYKVYPDTNTLETAVTAQKNYSGVKQNNDVAYATLNYLPTQCKSSSSKSGVKPLSTEEGQTVLVPAYKINCDFTYSIEGKSYDIPGVIIVTAY